MLVFSSVSGILKEISRLRSSNKSIGFVPTMGALHLGHASLIKQSVDENEITIVSVFVNPRQFNNPDDLLKYPRTESQDIALAEHYGASIVFLPEIEEVYSSDFIPPKISLGNLEHLMEGKMRPGHFDGVVQVLSRLFTIVQPNNAYFGLKDFQQVAVVRRLVEALNLPINIVACPIYREITGLAYSSRNQRLSDDQKEEALFIYRSLIKAKKMAQNHTPIEVMNEMIKDYQSSSLELEYFEIVHPKTLETLSDEWVDEAVACVVAYVGEVRLIDNMQIH